MLRKQEINAWIDAHEEEMVQSLCRLIKKASPRGNALEDKPFGEGPYEALIEGLKLADELGFATQNMDNCIGTADLGEGDPSIGILCHLDVVPEGSGWTMPAFEGIVKDGRVYGRGAIDDKGPAVSVLYAMKAVKEAGIALKNPVRFIVGTDEECGSSDLPHYKKYAKMPPMLFTPDGGYPVINIEKGMCRGEFTKEYAVLDALPRIVSASGGATVNAVPGTAQAVIAGMTKAELDRCLESLPAEVASSLEEMPDGAVKAVFTGKSAHASTPQDGINAMAAMLLFLGSLPLANPQEKEVLMDLCELFPYGQTDGKNVGLAMADQKSGALTLAFSVFAMEGGRVCGKCDIRFPVCATGEEVKSRLEKALQAKGFTLSCGVSEPHETPEDSAFVQTLLRTYHEMTGQDAYCVAIGGGTYVHHEEGGVAFGAEFPNAEDHHMHGADEFIEIKELVLNAKIFARAILSLQEIS